MRAERAPAPADALPPDAFEAAAWDAPAHVRAVVTTRRGGVSTGPRATLNVAAHVGDEPAAVAENRRRVRAALALPGEPLWLRQVHGTRVVAHEDAALADAPQGPEADAAVAFAPGRVLAIMTADCLPVAFTTRAGDRVGAAHAGWRGLAGGVLERTLDALRAPPSEVVAWLGPAIGPAAFEVGAEVREAFVAADESAAVAFVPNARGRWQADLYALARLRLARAGVGAVQGGGACTHADAERWFSFRRDRDAGRMAMLVWLEPYAPRTPTR